MTDSDSEIGTASLYDVLLARASQLEHSTTTSQHCCVPGCTSDSRYSGDKPIWFHAFPNDKDLKKAWLIKIRRDEGPLFKITKYTVVCSLHFVPSDYKWSPVKKLLKKGSVPTQFDWTKLTQPRSGKATNRQHAATSDVTVSNDVVDPEPMEVDTEVHTPDKQCHAPDPVQELQDALRKSQEENEKLKSENRQLQEQVSISRFGLERFSTDNTKIRFYTGFTSYMTLLTVFTWLQPSASSMRSIYYTPSDNVSLAGRKRNMLLIDEFFMFLCRLRLGLLEDDLADRFNCTVQTISRKVLTWVNYLYFVLGSIPIWLSRNQINRLMPNAFKKNYSSTRVIVDCTEFICQMPSSMVLNCQTYSFYKSRTTFKSFIGIAPHGAMTFLSSLYSGCMSDVEIFKISGIRELMESGDYVMADKGFRVGNYLAEKNIGLNMPPFLRSNVQFTPEEVSMNEEIASLRVHVERFNRRVKEYHIFDSVIPISMVGSINQLWSVACLLANFQGPLIAGGET